MSWWLSGPIQRHLHQQTELRNNDSQQGKNDNENGPRLDAVWSTMQATSACAGVSP